MAGRRFNKMPRRRISGPAEVLPRWRAAIEALDFEPAVRDIFLIAFYTGMRRGEIVSLRWERIDLERRILRVEETKTGEPLELPITRQLAAVFERLADIERPAAQPGGWVFPSSRSGTGHVAGVGHFHNTITEAVDTRFWFHGLRHYSWIRLIRERPPIDTGNSQQFSTLCKITTVDFPEQSGRLLPLAMSSA